MLSETLEKKDNRFEFACQAASGCFDGRFVLEEEIFWIGVSIELRENSGVEAWRPLRTLLREAWRGLVVVEVDVALCTLLPLHTSIGLLR